MALQEIPAELLPTLLDWLQADDRRAATAATLLARHEAVDRELETLWIAHDDWLRGALQEGLEALSVQTVRFDPVQPG